MALEIIIPKEGEVPNYTVTERYCLTEDDTLVLEGDLAARWLYAIPGQEIPWAEAKKYGLVKGDTPEAEAETDDETEPTLAERIEAVTSHADANSLGAELGLTFEEKKPKVDEKKDALREAAASLDETEDETEPDTE